VRLAPFVVFALAPLACRYSLDHRDIDADTNPRLCEESLQIQSCLSAAQESSFTYVQAQILAPKCAIAGSCHDGGLGYEAGHLDLRNLGSAYASLVNNPSQLDPTRMLVVPGNPAQSFLTVMIGQIRPEEADPPFTAIPNDSSGNFVGTMPQNAGVLCCQKLDAIERWIGSGAPMM
jgi:hypothetical protein